MAPVRGGDVYPMEALRYAGGLGVFWSAIATSYQNEAYYLIFSGNSVYPSGNETFLRFNGRSVRCVGDF